MSSPRLDRGVTSPELRLCLSLNRLGDSDRIRRFFSVVSRLGDGVVWYALMIWFAAFDWVTGDRVSLQMAAAGLFTYFLYQRLKRHTRRPRPYQRYQTITLHLAPLDEYSFPSGHTLHAVVFSTIAIVHQPTLVWILAPFTLLVAMSRVVLGLHYPSDVAAASVIGLSIALLSFAPM
ncbi:MAG: phosphatase PAP2 family protein [Ahniella sp.]|nr:phosphatase PAP2 family protein [Ahniella sp.]